MSKHISVCLTVCDYICVDYVCLCLYLGLSVCQCMCLVYCVTVCISVFIGICCVLLWYVSIGTCVRQYVRVFVLISQCVYICVCAYLQAGQSGLLYVTVSVVSVTVYICKISTHGF